MADTNAVTMNQSVNATMDKVKDKAIDFAFAHGPQLIAAVLIFVVGYFVARSVDKALMRVLNKKDIEPPVRMLITRAVNLLILGLVLMIALGTAGVNVVALVAGISVAGVGVGLAMQGVLSNIVAGLTIIFTKPFRVGEYIEMVGVAGQVHNIELTSTTLLHTDTSRVVVPNRKIVGEILHNYGQIRQIDVSVGVGCDSNVNEVLALVKEILANNPRVLKDPAPIVGVGGLGDWSIKIAVLPWTKLADAGPAGAELYQAIIERFRAARIEIPFPHSDVQLLNPPKAGG
jgi:small conductance mechanosensitive channel